MTLCDDMFIKVMPFVEWYSHLSSANSVISFSRLKKKKTMHMGKIKLEILDDIKADERNRFVC